MKHLFRLRSFIKPYVLPIAITNFALLAVTGLSLVIPRILQKVIDVGLFQGQVGYLAQAALLLLGLGLAIAAKIVQEHGGTIRAESNSPKGARFVVRLPVIEQAAISPPIGETEAMKGTAE